MFFIGWYLINRLGKFLILFFQKTKTNENAVSFLNSIIKIVIRIILIISVLGFLGVDLTPLIASIGAAAIVAVGLALKDNISSFVSGILLIMNKLIHIGDLIEVDSKKGRVVKIEMMHTTLQGEDGEKTIIIPNYKLLSNSITREGSYDLTLISINFKYKNVKNLTKDITRFWNREILLNRKILQVPEPKIIAKNDGKETFSVNIEVWSENKNATEVKNFLNNLAKKFESRIKAELEEIL